MDWKDADRISDKIVALTNEELNNGTNPIQAAAGQMLAMLSLANSAPPEAPLEWIHAMHSVRVCLRSMFERLKAN